MRNPRFPARCVTKGRKPLGFDLTKELLMTVPIAGAALLSLLAQDFNLTTNEARDIIRELEPMGIQLFSDRNATERVSMKLSHRTRNTEISEHYYQQVYGNRLLPAWQRREIA